MRLKSLPNQTRMSGVKTESKLNQSPISYRKGNHIPHSSVQIDKIYKKVSPFSHYI